MLARIGVAIVLSVACAHGGTRQRQHPRHRLSPRGTGCPGVTASTGTTTGARPWGPPVASQSGRVGGQADAGADRFGAGAAVLARAVDDRRPGAVGILLKLDPAIASSGTATVNALPHKKGAAQTMEMRTFTDDRALIRAAAVAGLQQDRTRVLAGQAAPGHRRGTRDVLRLRPFEIAGRPVNIFERDADRLVVYLDNNERIAWIGVLSATRLAADRTANHLRRRRAAPAAPQ